MSSLKRNIVAVFADADGAACGVRALQKGGFANQTVYSPAPRHEIEAALAEIKGTGPSPVRIWTLVGAFSGLITGFALPIITSLAWPLRTSGKAIVSLPAFVIIAFELTILFGAVAAVTGFAFHSRLPQLPMFAEYDPRFSEDRFGIVVDAAEGAETEEIKQLLQSAGAEEVRVEQLAESLTKIEASQ